jgi:copper chaperone
MPPDSPLIFAHKSIIMKTIAVKTNIMCGSCIAKATPTLNQEMGESNWNVDIKNPKKVLTVSGQDVTEEDVIKAVEKAGYKAERLSQKKRTGTSQARFCLALLLKVPYLCC